MSDTTVAEKVALTRSDIAKSVAELYEIPASLADKIVMTIFEEIAEAVSLDNTVAIPKFGKFKPVICAARNARNPKTGESIAVEEKASIRFKPSSSLKKALQS